MKFRSLLKLSLLTFILALAGTHANADVINFDNLGTGVVVTNQYPQVTFSSTTGFVNRTVAQNLGTSLPNFICTGPSTGNIDCAHETILDFTSPVNNLHFFAVGVNDMGAVAQVDVFQNNVFAGTVNVIGIGTIAPVPVVLSAFFNVTRIRIHAITDTVGIGWDDFTFEPAGTTPVPEPATMLLFGSGLVGVARKIGRRRSRL